jgi:hypothetical protein
MGDIRYHRGEESTPFTIIEAQRKELERLRAALRKIACHRKLDAAAAISMSRVAKDALAGKMPAEARKRVR